jgi:peptidoglycan-associated lipoprotein
MRKAYFSVAAFLMLLAPIIFLGSGCAKKVTPLPPAPAKSEAPPPAKPTPPAPTLTFSASPSTIERGQSSMLSWSTTNATSVTISGGVGTVEASGNRNVSPSSSTTYQARAAGPGGSASAETRITVMELPPEVVPPRTVTDNEFFDSNVKDIFFDLDKYEIREDARVQLQGNARALAERAGLRFTIEGHCDERGSEKYNLALGDRRANAAKEYLVSQGVGPDRMDSVSYGKERPYCSEHTEECWQKNRRAHFVLR